jgi:hypothetical protein
MRGGTGQKFEAAATVIAGVASLVATLMSIVSIWLQTKNYRKPLLQRYVVRILLMYGRELHLCIIGALTCA